MLFPWSSRKAHRPRETASRKRYRLQVEPLEDRCLLSVTFQSFPAFPSGGSPNLITSGPGGNLWFTDGETWAAPSSSSNRIGEMTPSGAVSVFTLPVSGTLTGIAGGPDGNLWLTENEVFGVPVTGHIWRMTPAGVFTEFSVARQTGAITAGPDGNVWFGLGQGQNASGVVTPVEIGRITSDGVITTFDLPYGDVIGGIAAGPDGNVWFTSSVMNGGYPAIGRISPSGNISLFNLPVFSDSPEGIAAGPDGNIWVTIDKVGPSSVGRITPTGIITEFTVTPGNSQQLLLGLAPGSDGNVWFPVETGMIGQITPAGTITEFTPPAAGAGFEWITAGSDGNLWFTDAVHNLIWKLIPDPPTPNQRFVTQVYQDLLHRGVDADGMAHWTGMLDQGASRFQVIMGIAGSTEYRTDVVEELYHHFLLRDADPDGLNHWVGLLAAGDTVEQVAAAIVGSPEYFQNRGAGSNDGLLNSLYADALRRGVDASGRATFDRMLANGGTRGQVAAAVFASAEYRRDLVESFYGQFLARMADRDGLNGWVALLQQRGRDEQVIAGIAGSDEFFAQF